MSTTIDQKVVEMRFDNRHFEKNVQGTLSTLEKLKQKLNLTGASKGLEQINASANKVNMNGMVNALNTVQTKFSALEVMGVTALANITNSAVNAGKRIASALTIQPITTGFNEYELKMDSVKTIMASTGESLETVNKYLEELNEYSDQTIYSFSDMTQNIGKFTNAGVKLEDAVLAIKGISNEAALSGANANEASRAMYNFAQALSVGYIQRIDWKSIELANMATVEFKEQLLESAIAIGTVTKNAEGMYATFENPEAFYNASAMFTETLDDQWLTTEVLINTLKDYSDATTDIGKRAYAAAQDVNKLTQVFDIAKEVGQSGWSKTWELIFGDLDEAKELFTGLSTFITDVQMVFINFRNDLLEGALGRGFKKLSKNISSITDPIEKTTKTVKKTTEALKTMNKMVKEVIRGDWGNGVARYKALTKAGYNYYAIQNKVNEKLGCAFRYSDELAGSQVYLNKTQKESVETQSDLIKTEDLQIEKLVEMSEAELEAIGLTKEQIESLKELKKYSEMTGLSIKDFIDNIDDIDGRWLLINSFKNAGKGLVSILKAIGNAWLDAFPPMQSDQLFNMIASLHKFSTHLVVSEETIDNLTRTLKGLFAIIDLIAMVVGGGFRVAFTIFKTILSMFNLDFLEFTALIGDGLVAIRNWIEDNNLIIIGVKALVEIIMSGVKAIKEWLSSIDFLSNGFNTLKTALKNIKKNITNWFEGLKETENVGQYIMDGLINGLADGATKVVKAMIEIGKAILETIKNILGIHSPSTEFFEIGKNIVDGLINGLKIGASAVYNFIKTIGEKCVSIFQGIDFGRLLAAGIGVGMIVVIKNLLGVIQNFTSPLESFGNLLDSLGDGFEAWAKGKKAKLMSEAMKNMAVSIAILAASVLVLIKIKPATLWATIGAIAALAAIIGLLAFAASKMNDLGDFGKSTLSLIGITASLFIVASALKKLSSIEPEQMKSTLIGFAGMIIGIGLLMAAFGEIGAIDKTKHIHKVGKMLVKISIALLIMVGVIKLASMLDGKTLARGLSVMTLLGVFVGALIFISSTAGEHAKKAGKMLTKISFALLIMLGVIKVAAMLKGEDIVKGIAVISALGIFFSSLMVVSQFAGKNAGKAGLMMILMSVALGITVTVIKQISALSMGDIIKGMAVVSALGVLFSALIVVSNFAGNNALKAGAMILMLSGALLILTGVIFLLSKMDAGGLYKALGVVTVLELLFMGLIYVSQYSKDTMKSIIAITVAVGLLIAAVIGLTFIDPQKLTTAAGSISAIIAALALLVGSTKFIGKPGDIIKTLLPITGVIAILAGILVLMSKLDTTSALESAGALSILLLALSASLAIASVIGPMAKQGVGALALMALVVGGLAAILGVMTHLDVNPSIETAKALSLLLIAMSSSLILLGVVGLLGPAAFIGIAALATLIVAIGGVVTAIGALTSKFPQLETFLDKGIPILQKIGYALGSFFGNIAGGFISGVGSALPGLGLMLSQFMINAQPFIIGVKTVDSSVLKGIGTLTASILALTAAQLVNGIVSFITLGSSFSTLGTELSMFMMNAMPFIIMSKQIDPSIMDGIKTLAEAIIILTGAKLVEGIGSWLSGGNSLSEFGTEIAKLGTSMNQFSTNLGTFDESKVTTVNCACNALKALAEAASEIPNEGGLWGKIAGENSLAAFGDKLPGLATHLNGFITNLGTFDKSKLTTVDCACDAIKSLAEAASEIPNEGGLWAAIVGDNSLASFADKLPGLGTHLNGFLSNLGTFDDTKVTTVECACKAIKTLAEAADSIPNEGGLWAAIVGDNSLAEFGDKLPDLGTNIADFVAKLGSFSDPQVTTIDSACKAINSLAKLGEIDVKDTGKGLKSFGKNMVKFAEKVKSFVSEIGEVGSEGITSAVDKTKELISMAQSVGEVNVDSLKTFGNSLKKVAKDGVSGFVKEFSDSAPKEDAANATKDMLDAAIEGAESKKSDVKNKFGTIAQAAISAMCTATLKTSATQAGKDLVVGFANGINNNKYLATTAGSSLGITALNAAKAALDENSPSKEAEKVGKFFGEGLVIGIKDYESKTYEAGYNIADKARVGLSRAIAKVSSMITNDIDAQPTIRPVLDLSEVESGAGYLNNMFNNPSVGVMANLNAINSGMRLRNQNGVNDDVVSAIDALRKDLGNVSGTTNNYNVNGVTYDDGSNITEAVKTIIRAAIQERRV